MAAYNYLEAVSHNCSIDCDSGECGVNYRIIRAYHDRCAEDEIPEVVEDGIHDFEEVCEDQGCNVFEEGHQVQCSENGVAGRQLVSVLTALGAIMTAIFA